MEKCPLSAQGSQWLSPWKVSESANHWMVTAAKGSQMCWIWSSELGTWSDRWEGRARHFSSPSTPLQTPKLQGVVRGMIMLWGSWRQFRLKDLCLRCLWAQCDTFQLFLSPCCVEFLEGIKGVSTSSLAVQRVLSSIQFSSHEEWTQTVRTIVSEVSASKSDCVQPPKVPVLIALNAGTVV
jgi:hypothetical protein